jgi:PAS domain S-box-containing protein
MIQEVQDYAILLLDKDGIIQNWNQGAEKIKGYTAEEIVGKNFRLFYTQEDRNRGLPEQLISEAIENGRAFHEGLRVRKDRTTFWGSIVITALHDTDGNIIGFSKVTRDLTEKKITEDRLKQFAEQLVDKNKELEQFAYIASHDLKEPLRKIIAFGDIVMNNFKTGGEKTEEYIKKMQEASLRMMALINDLLAFSKISNEKIEFQKTDLNKIIEQVKEDIHSVLHNKNVQLFIDPLPTCMVIPSQMRQLFQNLLTNAIKFNDKTAPEVHVTCEKINMSDKDKGVSYKIAVRDNGIGFSPAYKERIFDIFQRIHGRAEYAGTGIGLAICKKIMEAHNGSITADAIEEKGAVFTFILPEHHDDANPFDYSSISL